MRSQGDIKQIFSPEFGMDPKIGHREARLWQLQILPGFADRLLGVAKIEDRQISAGRAIRLCFPNYNVAVSEHLMTSI
jgi:hypothetical protein